MRLACTLEYKGTNYHGFQDQANLLTVQGQINRALKKISIEPESFNYSGRTDAGVHALGQVFDFETSVKRTPEDWLNGLNSNLPKTIAITSIQEVEPNFHSRFSAKERFYSYVIYNAKTKPLFFDDYVYWENMPLDLEVMNDAAQQLIGKHDFSSFRSSSCGSKNPIKDIKTISLEQNGAFIIMNISATAFLHNMVRIIAGTLISISKGELTMTMTELLEAKDRNLAGKTVSAKGLFFLGPRYDKSTGIKSPYSNLKSKFNL